MFGNLNQKKVKVNKKHFFYENQTCSSFDSVHDAPIVKFWELVLDVFFGLFRGHVNFHDFGILGEDPGRGSIEVSNNNNSRLGEDFGGGRQTDPRHFLGADPSGRGPGGPSPPPFISGLVAKHQPI